MDRALERSSDIFGRGLPAWLKPGPDLLRLAAVACLVAVVYGSLIPLEPAPGFQAPDSIPGFASWVIGLITSPRLVPWSEILYAARGDRWAAISDIVVNILLYLPAGLFLALDQRSRGATRARQIFTALLVIGSIAWLCECAQSLLAGRCGAINDALPNALGGLLGAALALTASDLARRVVFFFYCARAGEIHEWNKRLCRDPSTRPIDWLARALALLCVLFWVTFSARGFGAGDRDVPRWMPLAEYFNRPYYDALADVTVGLASYVLAAALLLPELLRARRATSPRGSSWGGGVATLALALAMLALAAGLVRLSMGSPLMMTDPLLALTALGLVLACLSVATWAIRVSCRRRSGQPVEVDRRRFSHRYATQPSRPSVTGPERVSAWPASHPPLPKGSAGLMRPSRPPTL